MKCKKCGYNGEPYKNGDCPVCARQATKKWRDNPANKEKRLMHKRKYNKLHPEKAKEYKKRNYENNKADWIKRRERRLKWMKKGNVTKLQLIKLYAESDGKCKYCNCDVVNPRFDPFNPRGFDHVVSLANGGEHSINNMVVCCGSCNKHKSYLTLSQYLIYKRSRV